MNDQQKRLRDLKFELYDFIAYNKNLFDFVIPEWEFEPQTQICEINIFYKK